MYYKYKNNNIYFEKYGKLKRTTEALESLIIETKAQIDHLESIQNALEIATSSDDLVQIKEELAEYGFIKKNRGAKKEKTKSKLLKASEKGVFFSIYYRYHRVKWERRQNGRF